MISLDFNSTLELLRAYPNEKECIKYLERVRWDGNVVSPFDKDSKVYKCKHGSYKCCSTGKYFNVKTNTFFHGTKRPLQTWFLAFWLVTVAKKGITSIELGEQLGIPQSRAYGMSIKIKALFKEENTGRLKGKNIVYEVDETFVGGKRKNMHVDKKPDYDLGLPYWGKTPVMGIFERGGKCIVRVVPDTKKHSLLPLIRDHVSDWCTIYSDELRAYTSLKKNYVHECVYHARKNWANGECHTNNAESAWSTLKRTIIGTHHWISTRKLQLYVDEFVFKRNYRELKPNERWGIMVDQFCRVGKVA